MWFLLLLVFLTVSSVARATEAPAEPGSGPQVRAAFGDGVTVASGDGGFELNARVRSQFRADAVKTEDEDPVAGFMVRRMRLSIKANALDELFDFAIQLAFSPRDIESDMPTPLRDAYATLNLHRDVRLRLGQMKVPFDRQYLTSSGALALADRSIAVTALLLERDVGAYWLSDDLAGLGILKAQVGVFGGDGRNRLNTDLGMLYAARVQLHPLGKFADLDEAELDRDAPPKLAFAAAVAFNDDSPRKLSTSSDYDLEARTDFVHGTVDALGKVAGMTAFAAVLVRVATETKGHDDAMSAVGGVLQLGALVTDHVEVIGRVARLHPLPREWLVVPNPADFQGSTEVRPGVNVYVHEHDAKLQGSVGVVVLDDFTRTVDGQIHLDLYF